MLRLTRGVPLIAVALATNCADVESPGPDTLFGPSAQVAEATGASSIPLLRINAPASIAGDYAAGAATFGSPLTPIGVTAEVNLALDEANAAGPSMTDACSALTNPAGVAGRIALVDRGTCAFVTKVKNAQLAGAVAVIVADNVPGPPQNMGGSDPTIIIPSVRISQADGNRIKAELASGPVNATLTAIPDEQPPTLTVPENMTVNATSPAGATVTYAVSASDNVDPSPVVSCTPPSGETFPIGTTTVTCAATDAAGNTAAPASFQITVKSAQDQINDFQSTLTGLNLPEGTETSLEQKLAAALAALAAGERDAACGLLQALINQVNAQSGKKITAADAAVLIAEAERIRAVLGC